MMVLHNLYQLEDKSRLVIFREKRRLRSIRAIKELLNQLDFSTERIPEDNPERLRELLVELKGSNLSRWEEELVQDIFMVKTEV
jgi:hypothetical protein